MSEEITYDGDKSILILEKLLNYNTLTLFGLKGAGKTYGMADMAMLVRGNKKVFVFDTIGEITDKQLVAGALYIKMAALSPKQLWKVFETCYKEYKFIVLDLSDYIPSQLVYFADVFADWALARRGRRMALFVDEIGDYCPQTKEVYSEGFERLWRVGRNYGINPVVLATQRTQKADKNLLALSQVYIIMQLINKLDRDKVKDLVGTKSKEEWEMMEKKIMELKEREAYVFDARLNFFKIRFPDVYEVQRLIGGKYEIPADKQEIQAKT